MSAELGVNVFADKARETSPGCVVVSIYEDITGRDLLFRLCDFLAHKFKDDLEFQFDWWRFKYLADPEIAMEAAQRAAEADLILVAAQSPELPVAVQMWFEGWLPNRVATRGALALVQPSPKGVWQSLPLGSYLRRTARLAGLDYLSLNPAQSEAGVIVTTAGANLFEPEKSDILPDDDRPQHWGINE